MSEHDKTRRETRRQKIQLQKRRRLIALALAAVILALLIFGIVKLVGWIAKPKYGESANIGPTPAASGEPVSILSPPQFYDYSLPVPETGTAPEGYFSKVLFVGDSRVSGFPLYGMIAGADFLAGNTNIEQAESYKFDFNGAETTLVDQLASKQYDAVYIMFGLNELSWQDAEAYRGYYASLVSTVQTLAPGSVIYLQSTIPVSTALSGEGTFSNEQVAAYNGVTASLATEKQVYYLDIAAALSAVSAAVPSASPAPSGSPAPSASGQEEAPSVAVGGYPALSSQYAESNGYSLTRGGYSAWYEYLGTHVVDRSLYAN